MKQNWNKQRILGEWIDGQVMELDENVSWKIDSPLNFTWSVSLNLFFVFWTSYVLKSSFSNVVAILNSTPCELYIT